MLPEALKPGVLQPLQVHLGTLAELRLAARDRRQNLVLAARQRVAAEVAKAGLAESANLHTESECSTTTEWWRSRVRAAETIEEVSRLEVNFKKLQKLQKETQSCIDISSESEGEAVWLDDPEARLHPHTFGRCRKEGASIQTPSSRIHVIPQAPNPNQTLNPKP